MSKREDYEAGLAKIHADSFALMDSSDCSEAMEAKHLAARFKEILVQPNPSEDDCRWVLIALLDAMRGAYSDLDEALKDLPPLDEWDWQSNEFKAGRLILSTATVAASVQHSGVIKRWYDGIATYEKAWLAPLPVELHGWHPYLLAIEGVEAPEQSVPPGQVLQ